MISASQEQTSFREESERLELEYYAKLANDANADKDDRDWAAAKLNEDFRHGMKAFEEGNYRDAEFYLEKAANDSSLNTYGKIEAMQKLMEICNMNQDKVSWMKWLGKMLKEAKNMDGFQQVKAFDNFEQIVEQMKQVSDLLKNNPETHQDVIKSMKERYKFSDDEAQKAVDDLINFKLPF